MATGINVGHLFKQKIVRDTGGNIIDWFDEANGGWIIRKRGIVNQERYDEIQRKQKEKEEAAKVLAMAIADPASFRNPDAPAEERNTAPSKVADLEAKVNTMEGNINKILELLTPKHDHQPVRDEEKM